jgi:hypothetical protein
MLMFPHLTVRGTSTGRLNFGFVAGTQEIAKEPGVNRQRDGFYHLSPASKRKVFLGYDVRRVYSCGL